MKVREGEGGRKTKGEGRQRGKKTLGDYFIYFCLGIELQASHMLGKTPLPQNSIESRAGESGKRITDP